VLRHCTGWPASARLADDRLEAVLDCGDADAAAWQSWTGPLAAICASPIACRRWPASTPPPSVSIATDPAQGSYDTALVWQNRTSDPTCASSCKPSALQKRVPPSCTERVADYVRVEVADG